MFTRHPCGPFCRCGPVAPLPCYVTLMDYVPEVEATVSVKASTKRGAKTKQEESKEETLKSKDETITKPAPRGRRGAKAVVEPAVDATPTGKHAEFVYEVAEEVTKAKATMKVVRSKAVVSEVIKSEVDVVAEPTPKPIKGLRGDKKLKSQLLHPMLVQLRGAELRLR